MYHRGPKCDITTQISAMGKKYPSQALRMLRLSAGACRGEFVQQALGSSAISQALSSAISGHLRSGLTHVLQAPVTQETWTQATTPLKLGGLGLRDPVVSRTAARLASLVNAENFALQLGADAGYLLMVKEQAVQEYQHQLRSGVAPALEPSKELQAELTLPIYLRRVDALVQAASGDDKQRLSSLGTTHATTWTLAGAPDGSRVPVGPPLDAGHSSARAGVRLSLLWGTGTRTRSTRRLLPANGGHHPCPQLPEGHRPRRPCPGRVHGFEGAVTGEARRAAAGVLLIGYGKRPLAIDFTVITPVRPSAALGPPGALMDSAARAKCRNTGRRATKRAGISCLSSRTRLGQSAVTLALLWAPSSREKPKPSRRCSPTKLGRRSGARSLEPPFTALRRS